MSRHSRVTLIYHTCDTPNSRYQVDEEIKLVQPYVRQVNWQFVACPKTTIEELHMTRLRSLRPHRRQPGEPSPLNLWHFSGHAERGGRLMVYERKDGRLVTIAPELLTSGFEARRFDGVLVLNACHSKSLALRLQPFVTAIVCLPGPVLDEACVDLAACFYENLTAPGVSLDDACAFTSARIASQYGIDQKLELVHADGFDPKTWIPVAEDHEAPDIDEAEELRSLDARVRSSERKYGDRTMQASVDWRRRVLKDQVDQPLVVPGTELDDRMRWRDWDMSILLLEKAELRTGPEGTQLTLRLQGNEVGIYSNKGKQFIKHHFLDMPTEPPGSLSARAKRALDVAQQIHEAQLGGLGRDFSSVIGGALPVVRWASGGYLPIVRWREHRWVLLFFRDIDPIGWNIANGASESAFERLDIDVLCSREAAEEIIVMSERPQPFSSEPIALRELNLGGGAKTAGPLVYAHNKSRRSESLRLQQRADVEEIDIRRIDGPSKLVVVDADGASFATKGLYLTFNALELGIEATRVAEFDLPPEACVLDGEAFTYGGHTQLIRRPVGLFRLDYLQRSFTSPTRLGQPIPHSERRRLPEPGPGEFHLFDYDVKTRLQIAGPGSPEQKWLDTWGEPFAAIEHGVFHPDLLSMGPATWRVIELARDQLFARGEGESV